MQRTHLALNRALLELMVETGYEKLTVQHILDRALVGRATFYLHYRSKEDLLRRSLDMLAQHLREACRSPHGLTLAFFRHVDQHRELYRAIVGRESGFIVDQQMRRVVAALLREESGGSGVQAEFVAEYVTGALMSVVTWWLGRNIRLTPEQVDETFRGMTVPGRRLAGGPAADEGVCPTL